MKEDENVVLPELRELALFAGAGGGILGGVLCGWRTVAAVEIEEYPRAVLLRRQADGLLPRFPVWDDVRTFAGEPWRGRVDVISGGFPCQDISAAGKGAGIDGERSGLWSEFARIIGEVRPRYVFVENSPMLVGRGLTRVLGYLASLGFDAEWGVIGAHHAGAPHKRDRIWIVANAHGVRLERHELFKSDLSTGSSEDVADSGFISGRTEQRHKQPKRNALGEPVGDCGGDVADAVRDGSQGSWQDGSTARPAGLCGGARRDEEQHLPDTEDERLLRRERSGGEGAGERGSDGRGEAVDAGGQWWAVEPRLGVLVDGMANRLDQFGLTPEESVPRVAKGVLDRVARLKAIGNGQVSAVVKLAWELLK